MKRQAGNQAEDLAAAYLVDQGYRVLSRNYRTEYGEIDIICEKDGDLVFVEVRSRSTGGFGLPEESITARKMGRIRRTALAYLAQGEAKRFRRLRFDVIAIRIGPGKPEIRHIEGAF